MLWRQKDEFRRALWTLRGKAVVAALTCNASTLKFGMLRQEDSWELETNQSYIEKKTLFQKQQQFFLKKIKGNFGDVSYVFMLLTVMFHGYSTCG